MLIIWRLGIRLWCSWGHPQLIISRAKFSNTLTSCKILKGFQQLQANAAMLCPSLSTGQELWWFTAHMHAQSLLFTCRRYLVCIMSFGSAMEEESLTSIFPGWWHEQRAWLRSQFLTTNSSARPVIPDTQLTSVKTSIKWENSQAVKTGKPCLHLALCTGFDGKCWIFLSFWCSKNTVCGNKKDHFALRSHLNHIRMSGGLHCRLEKTLYVM